jgi:ketosteroid isomerase-like protein
VPEIVPMTDEEVLLAEAGVRRAIAQYAAHLDARDRDACLALFADDARFVAMGQEMTGHEDIAGWLVGLPDAPAGIHLTTNTVVTCDCPSAASARSDFALIKNGGAGWHVTVAGRYADRLIRHGGRWLFVSRIIEIL